MAESTAKDKVDSGDLEDAAVGKSAETEETNVDDSKEEKLFTQAELNQKIDQRFARERTKYEVLENKYKDLESKFFSTVEEYEENKLSLAKLEEEKNDLVATKEKDSLEALRYKVALKNNVPEDLVDFLTGDNEEEISDKAQRLSKLQEGSLRGSYAGKIIYADKVSDDPEKAALEEMVNAKR